EAGPAPPKLRRLVGVVRRTVGDVVSATELSPSIVSAATPPEALDRRPVDWRRVISPVAVIALCASLAAAIGVSLGSVVAGKLAENATTQLVELLALCVIGGALLDAVGRTLWAGAVDRAEGQLRADLLVAALDQPLSELNEQAVGEVLDRVD